MTPIDQAPVGGWSIADLDLELFRSIYPPSAVSAETLAENERTTEQHLSSLGLLDPRTREARVVGLLVVGFDPSSFVPGAYLQFVRYEGIDPAAPVVGHEELRGNLVGQLQTLSRIHIANIRTAVIDVEPLRQTDRSDYPLPALRELVLNAVTHRDYAHYNAPVRVLWFADRVEISSPGGPFGVVSRDTFDHRTDYRNPTLASAMKAPGYVSRFRRGISVVRASLERNGNPPPHFDIEDHYWSVTVRGAL